SFSTSFFFFSRLTLSWSAAPEASSATISSSRRRCSARSRTSFSRSSRSFWLCMAVLAFRRSRCDIRNYRRVRRSRQDDGLGVSGFVLGIQALIVVQMQTHRKISLSQTVHIARAPVGQAKPYLASL